MENIIREFLEENWEEFLEKAAEENDYSEEEINRELDRIL
jgi:hypothetical protein